MGIEPAEWDDPPPATMDEIAQFFIDSGIAQRDADGLFIPGMDTAAVKLRFDPAKRDPATGLRSCVFHVAACMRATKLVDGCVVAMPRCASTEPWLGDPNRDDCCPEACVLDYLDRRAAGISAPEAVVAMTQSACYPGFEQYTTGDSQ